MEEEGTDTNGEDGPDLEDDGILAGGRAGPAATTSSLPDGDARLPSCVFRI